MGNEPVVLTENEAAALAQLLVARQAENADMWLLWEDLPMLAEGSFEAVSRCVGDVAKRLRTDLASRERVWDADARALLEAAQ